MSSLLNDIWIFRSKIWSLNQVSEKIAGSDIELSKIRIVEPRLYNIIETPNGQTHTITINVNNSDFEIFTFTFGWKMVVYE